MLASLLTLSDVMATGHHAAVCADVRPGGTVAVVGDGAVGLSGVLAAKRLGAGRIIALSAVTPSARQLAREFGATDIVEQRGEEATEAVMELTDGVGVDATLECVGTGQAMQTALSIARPGSMVGYVGVPHGVELPIGEMFFRNKGVRGGSAPARAYIPELLPDVLEGRINPGRVLDYETDLDGHRRRLRRDGRAPRDQVARPRGDPVMTAWTDDEAPVYPFGMNPDHPTGGWVRTGVRRDDPGIQRRRRIVPGDRRDGRDRRDAVAPSPAPAACSSRWWWSSSPSAW